MPGYLRQALEERGLMDVYQARPPYQRNDYVGWIDRAKRSETKVRRLEQMLDELAPGDRYMKMPYHAKTAPGGNAPPGARASGAAMLADLHSSAGWSAS